jgi:bifunctional DNase/RNase
MDKLRLVPFTQQEIHELSLSILKKVCPSITSLSIHRLTELTYAAQLKSPIIARDFIDTHPKDKIIC